jgi:hypothetical protein
MKQGNSGEKPLRWHDVLFVLSFFPAVFIGIFILVPGFEVKTQPWHLWTFGVSLIVLGFSSLCIIWRKLQKDRYPNILAFTQGVPYEAAGVQVIPVRSPAVAPPGGPLRIGIFFQNRFDAESRLVVRLKYPWGATAMERTVDVAPGEAGFAWQTVTLSDNIAVGPAFLKLELEGTRGSGPEVRFTEGKIVRSDASKILEALATWSVELGGNQDSLPLQIAADASPIHHWGDREGLLRLWVRGMPQGKTQEAVGQARALLQPPVN